MSASDMNTNCYKFVHNNLQRGAPTHWFPTMRDQIRNTNCLVHSGSVCCAGIPETPDVYIAGTPCHPYSTQRTSRFATGSVVNHKEFDVSMGDFVDAMTLAEPTVVVAEQVEGFDMPVQKGAGRSQTPLKMFLCKVKMFFELHCSTDC